MRAALLALLLASCPTVDTARGPGTHCASDADCDGDGARCGVTSDGQQVCLPATTCDPASFGGACAGENLVFCDTDKKTATSFDCNHFFSSVATPDLTCGVIPCVGGGCATIDLHFCMGDAAGSTCREPLRDIWGPVAGGQAFCNAGQSCVLAGTDTGVQETCVTGPVCTTPFTGTCNGTTAVNCYGAGADGVVSSGSAIDCASLGGTCFQKPDGSFGAGCTVPAGKPCGSDFLPCVAGTTCNGFSPDAFTLGKCE